MRTHGDPKLADLTAEQLTISAGAGVDLNFGEECSAEPQPEQPAPLANVENSVSTTPISAFCFIPNKSDVVENHCRVPRYGAAVAGGVGGSGAVDLFHDSSAYVQHCLSFVALPTADYIPQTDLTVPPSLAYIHQQHQP